jgi:Fe-S cluster assembly protein SufB
VAEQATIDAVASQGGDRYKYGFVTDIESVKAPKGLTADTVRYISAKKEEPQWLLDWRLQAFRAWLKTTAPEWAKLEIAPIDYQAHTYYSAPKQKITIDSLDQIDPELLKTYEKLGIPLQEQKRLVISSFGCLQLSHPNYRISHLLPFPRTEQVLHPMACLNLT